MSQRTFYKSFYGWKSPYRYEKYESASKGYMLATEPQKRLVAELCEKLNCPVPDMYFYNRHMAIKKIDDLKRKLTDASKR